MQALGQEIPEPLQPAGPTWPLALEEGLRADGGIVVVAAPVDVRLEDLLEGLVNLRQSLRGRADTRAWRAGDEDGTSARRALMAVELGACVIVGFAVADLGTALQRLLPHAEFSGEPLRNAFLRRWSLAAWFVPVPRGSSPGSAYATELVLPDERTRGAIEDGDWSFFELEAARPASAPGRDEQLLEGVRANRILVGDALARARDPQALRRRLETLPAPPSSALEAGAAAMQDPFDDLFGVAGATAPAPRPPSRPSPFPADWDPFQSLPMAGAAAPKRAPPPPDPLQLRAYAPASALPGRLQAVDIWACLATQATEVDRLAASTEPRPLAALRSGIAVAHGTLLGVRLGVGTLRVEPAEQTMVWTGEPANACFVVEVPAGLPDADLLAQAQVTADGVPIGSIVFALRVRAHGPAAMEPSLQAEMRSHRSAFASYASEDREAMLARISGIKAWVRDIDIFVDVQNLRAGDRWQERIDAELRRRERLLLFWSSHARASPWVDYEWRSALRLKGVDAIDPVPLQDPRDAPPPPELAQLHFNESLLPLLAAERARGG